MVNNYKLLNVVMNNSEADNWEDAVNEWTITDCSEDERQTSECICGKENIKYLFTIENKFNGNVLYPIGSSCIKKFHRKDMNDEANVHERSFKLLHAVEDNRYLSLSTEYFSRKLLLWLYNEGAFDSEYNNFDGQDDYEFMVKMFNKRDKDSITVKQDKKIKAILLNSIKPYLKEILDDRIMK